MRCKTGRRLEHEDCVSTLLCSQLEMQSRNHWDLVPLDIEASLRTAFAAALPTSLRICALPEFIEVPKTATRESLGTISFKSSSFFPLISGARLDSPVMFPPGRARLATNPFPTGSGSCAITMGIVDVACLAGRVAWGPAVTMMSTLRRTSSAASSGSRSNFPSAHRDSIDNVFPLYVAKVA